MMALMALTMVLTAVRCLGWVLYTDTDMFFVYIHMCFYHIGSSICLLFPPLLLFQVLPLFVHPGFFSCFCSSASLSASAHRPCSLLLLPRLVQQRPPRREPSQHPPPHPLARVLHPPAPRVHPAPDLFLGEPGPFLVLAGVHDDCGRRRPGLLVGNCWRWCRCCCRRRRRRRGGDVAVGYAPARGDARHVLPHVHQQAHLAPPAARLPERDGEGLVVGFLAGVFLFRGDAEARRRRQPLVPVPIPILAPIPIAIPSLILMPQRRRSSSSNPSRGRRRVGRKRRRHHAQRAVEARHAQARLLAQLARRGVQDGGVAREGDAAAGDLPLEGVGV